MALFFIKKQCHLLANCKLPSLHLQAFANSHFYDFYISSKFVGEHLSNTHLPKKPIFTKTKTWLNICLFLSRARGCKLPNLPLDGGGGHFTKNEVSLNFNTLVEHGVNVDVICHTGYFLKGIIHNWNWQKLHWAFINYVSTLRFFIMPFYRFI